MKNSKKPPGAPGALIWIPRMSLASLAWVSRVTKLGTRSGLVHGPRFGTLDVVVLNVASVFAQVRHHAARLSQRGHVIEVVVPPLMFHRAGRERVKKLIAGLAGLVVIAACSSSPAPAPGPAPATAATGTGAADAPSAVRAYLRAVEQQDLQAMGAVWGGPDGPARDLLPREELFQREMVMMCTLKHDRYDLVGDAPTPSGGRAIIVNLFTKNDSHAHTFDVVPGPVGRWYVRSVDVRTLTSCGKS
jgi:hypothetical protein